MDTDSVPTIRSRKPTFALVALLINTRDGRHLRVRLDLFNVVVCEPPVPSSRCSAALPIEIIDVTRVFTPVVLHMKRLAYWQIAAVAALLMSYTIVSLVSKPGFALSAFSDITNFSLWIIAVGVMLWTAFSNEGRTRWFWLLLAMGGVMVGANLGAWFVEEVILRKSPPEPFWADIPLFLQPVPMMAAAAMRPGSRQQVQKFYLSTLNFVILVLWWVYIYAFLIFPNEYIVFNKVFFNHYYYILFVMESAVLLAILGGMAMVAEGAWRKIYWSLFFAGSMYLLAFQWLNAALERDEYYSGSLYDVPNTASICFFILIAISARNVPAEALSSRARERPHRRARNPGGDGGVVTARDRFVGAVPWPTLQPTAAVPSVGHHDCHSRAWHLRVFASAVDDQRNEASSVRV